MALTTVRATSRAISSMPWYASAAGGSGHANGQRPVAAKSAADGYTLVITVVGTWAINPHIYKLPYDVVRDFAPIVHIATTPGVWKVSEPKSS